MVLLNSSVPPPLDGFAFDQRSREIDLIHALCSLYTSYHVVDEMLDDINWPHESGRLVDVCCGDGSFLLRALRRLPLPKDDLSALDRVRGSEIHPGAVADARENIEELLRAQGWSPHFARQGAELVVTERDFLTDGPPPGEFRFQCTNPPYLRMPFIPPVLREVYCARLPKHAHGDMLHMFLDRACAMRPHDGLLAFVAADRFLFNEGTTALRKELGRHVDIEKLSRLDPSTTFYRPKRRVKNSLPRVHPVKLILVPRGSGKMPFTGEPISPDAFGRAPSVTAVPTISLETLATIRLAPWLGPRGLFVVDPDVAKTLTNADLVPAVDARDLTDRDVIDSAPRFALRLDPDREPTGAVREHLLANYHLMPRTWKRREFWRTPEPIRMPLDEPALLIPRIAKRLRVLRLKPGILPLNHQLTVVSASPTHSLDKIERALLSDISQQWVFENAPHLENGYLQLNTSLLRRLPVPVVT